MYRLMLLSLVLCCATASVEAKPHPVKKRFKKKKNNKAALEVPPMPVRKQPVKNEHDYKTMPIRKQPVKKEHDYKAMPIRKKKKKKATALDQAIATNASRRQLSLKRKKKRRQAASLNIDSVS